MSRIGRRNTVSVAPAAAAEAPEPAISSKRRETISKRAFFRSSAPTDPGSNIKKFMKTVAKGDLPAIRKWVPRKLPISSKDKLGRNGLHIAALNSQEKSFRLLLELGCDPAHLDDQDWTPLHAACSVGHCDIAETCIASLESRAVLYKIINHKDLVECTPLHLACISGCISLVRTLVRNKADISLKDGNGRTALEICIGKKDTQLANALKESLEEQSKKTTKRNDDLSVAIKEDNLAEVVKALLNGLNMNTKTKDNQSLLYISACAGSMDITNMLLGRGADVNIKNFYGRTVLHQLVLEGYKTMFDIIVARPDVDVACVDDIGRNVLHSAAECGRGAFIGPLVERGADIEVRDQDGCTPLHLAARYGRKSALSVLLSDHKANVAATDNLKQTPLHHAARWKKVQCMKMLIESGADINAINAEGETPLHLCCMQFKFSPAVSLLVEKGVDTNIRDNKKNTPLLLLVKWKRPKEMPAAEGVLLVKKAGAYIEQQLYQEDYITHTTISKLIIERMKETDGLNIQDDQDRTALHWAIINRHKEVAVALIHAGADAHIKDKQGGTPLTVLEQPLYPSNIRQHILKALEEYAAKVSVKTPEELAEKVVDLVASNNVTEINNLLATDEKLEESFHTLSNQDGQSMLHLAALYGAIETCLCIMSHGGFSTLSLHKKDKNGNTPLHLAAQNNHETICRELLAAGADVIAKNKEKKIPSELAAGSLAQHLQEIEIKTRTEKLFLAMEETTQTNSSAIAISIIKEGIDNQQMDQYGCTPLIVACIQGLDDVVKALIATGVDVNAVDENYQSALHWAAMKGNKSCIQLLLENNASVNDPDVMEQTPLHWAVIKDQPQSAILLVKAGADITAMNSDGQTPLDCASDEMKSSLTTYSQLAEEGPRDPKKCTEELFEILSGKEFLPNRVQELLEEGADINALDEHGSTLVCAASIQGCADTVKIIISHGCHVGMPDNCGQTPLHWAAIKGHCSVAQLLIDSKADINCSDTAYRTPFHWAVLQNHKEFVRVLMRAGADQTLADEEGQTPFDLAGGDIRDTIEEFLKTPRRRNSSRGEIVRTRRRKDTPDESQEGANEEKVNADGT